MVPDPINGQAWNRYSYVVNNPLAFTDPTGYCFLGLCGGIGNILQGIPHLLRDVPIVGTIVEVAAAAICGRRRSVCAVTAAFLSTTAVAGIETGNLELGLRAGLIAAATAVAFWEVGNLTDMIAGVGSQAKDTFNRNSAPRRMRSTSRPMPRSGARRPSRLAASAAPPLWPAASPRPQDP